MKGWLIAGLWRRRRICRVAALGLLVVDVAFAVRAGESNLPPAGEYALVKHRVEVVVPSPADAATKFDVNVTIGKDLVDAKLPTEGTSVRAQELASAVDLLKSRLAESEMLRLVETGRGAGTTEAQNSAKSPFILYARFATQAKESVAYLRLVNRADQTLLAKGDGRGEDLAQAITVGISQVEKELLNRAWRCRVVDVSNGKLIIPFGRLDGLRKGQLLIGYSLTAEARKAESAPDEVLLLKHGTRAGPYRIVEVGEEVTSLQPLENGAALEKGDILEAPAAALHEIHRSRNSTLWDKVYENKR